MPTDALPIPSENPTSHQGFHIHPLHAAVLDPSELEEETSALFHWAYQVLPSPKPEIAEAQAALKSKDTKTLWKIVGDWHLQLTERNPQHQASLLGWQTCNMLHLAHQKYESFQVPYPAIFQPNTEAPSPYDYQTKTREGLILSIGFEPFSPNLPKTEYEIPRHFLAFTLLSFLNSTDQKESEIPLQEKMPWFKSLAYSHTIPEPVAQIEEPNPRRNALTRAILLLAYGGKITTGKWCRPNLDSITQLLNYIFGSGYSRFSAHLPQEIQAYYSSLSKQNLL